MHYKDEIKQHGYLQTDHNEHELRTKVQINHYVESESLSLRQKQSH